PEHRIVERGQGGGRRLMTADLPLAALANVVGWWMVHEAIQETHRSISFKYVISGLIRSPLVTSVPPVPDLQI
ncbi:hypothetical protein ACCT09_25460, partial [Rhizobium ruizarguesonis]